MPKPSTLPEWATDPGAVIAEPTLSKKKAGWLSPEKPSDGAFNWWMRTVYEWIDWLSGSAVSTFTDVTSMAAATGAQADWLTDVYGYGIYRYAPSYVGVLDGKTAVASISGGAWLLDAPSPDVTYQLLEPITDSVQAQLAEQIPHQYALTGLLTWDSPNIGANSSSSTNLAVNGARLGDMAMAYPCGNLDPRLILSAYVSADGVVTMRLGNPSAGGIDPASIPYRIVVWKF